MSPLDVILFGFTLALVLVVIAGFAMSSGADSRDPIPDDHRR